jgi:hypothetical protein
MHTESKMGKVKTCKREMHDVIRNGSAQSQSHICRNSVQKTKLNKTQHMADIINIS